MATAGGRSLLQPYERIACTAVRARRIGEQKNAADITILLVITAYSDLEWIEKSPCGVTVSQLGETTLCKDDSKVLVLAGNALLGCPKEELIHRKRNRCERVRSMYDVHVFSNSLNGSYVD